MATLFLLDSQMALSKALVYENTTLAAAAAAD
jgi:hypothetical protein